MVWASVGTVPGLLQYSTVLYYAVLSAESCKPKKTYVPYSTRIAVRPGLTALGQPHSDLIVVITCEYSPIIVRVLVRCNCYGVLRTIQYGTSVPLNLKSQ